MVLAVGVAADRPGLFLCPLWFCKPQRPYGVDVSSLLECSVSSRSAARSGRLFAPVFHQPGRRPDPLRYRSCPYHFRNRLRLTRSLVESRITDRACEHFHLADGWNGLVEVHWPLVNREATSSKDMLR